MSGQSIMSLIGMADPPPSSGEVATGLPGAAAGAETLGASAPVSSPSSAPPPGGGGVPPGPDGSGPGGMGGMLGAIGGPLVAGGLDLLGGLFQMGGQQASINQQEAFQQRMSSTAYQRAVADMRAAGLNPALMYGSGGPESSPAGAMATPPNILQGTMSSAYEFAQAMQGMKMTQAQIDQVNSATAKNLVDAQLSRADLPGAESSAQAFKDFPWLGAADEIIGTVGKGIGNVVDAFALKKLLLGSTTTSSRSVGPGLMSTRTTTTR